MQAKQEREAVRSLQGELQQVRQQEQRARHALSQERRKVSTRLPGDYCSAKNASRTSNQTVSNPAQQQGQVLCTVIITPLAMCT